jgi:hypothetical protein
MRTNVLIFLTAAVPALLTASTFPIGFSTTPVDFTPISSSNGTVTLGTCSPKCVLDGQFATNIPVLKWTLLSDGTLSYTSSGSPDVYDLAGTATAFSLTDVAGDSIPGTITWNTATVGATVPHVSGTFTDVNGTLKLGTVSFVSNTDPLAEEVIAAFGSLPLSGETGSLDFLVNCAPVTCISAPTALFATTSRFTTKSKGHKHGLKDPPGLIQFADVTLNSSAVPEPGTIFVVPALFLGGLILLKRRGWFTR